MTDANKVLEDCVEASDWDYTVSMWLKKGDECIQSKGRSSYHEAFGGRFLEGNYKGNTVINGQCFEGRDVLTFNKMKNEFLCVWYDNMDCSFMKSSGTYDAATKTINLKGVFDEPHTGRKNVSFRNELVFEKDNSMVNSMYQTADDGKEFMCMRVESTKRSKPAKRSIAEINGDANQNEETKKVKTNNAASSTSSNISQLSMITLLTNSQQETLDFYVNKLSFVKTKDVKYGSTRWLTIKAPKQSQLQITIVEADTDLKKQTVGKQAGGHVLFVLETDDIASDFKRLKESGVTFNGEPKEQFWGTEVTFNDHLGNVIDFVQPKAH